MCGIAGIVTNEANVSRDKLQAMTDVIAHRGPDGEGFWISDDGCVGFGHRRLSIIDLSDMGHQPMHYRNGRYTITFNGEIYNFVELREQLQKYGYAFQSSSDTEVLLALYDRHKEKCLQYLDGMFAFAIWDEEEKELFVARDRFGEKPFHYAYVPRELFVFGSEMKELWSYGLPKEVSYDMLYRYLINRDVQNANDPSQTFFKNVFRLPAGHYGKLKLSELQFTVERYWDIDYQNIDYGISEKRAENDLRELMFTSINRRMRSDVPIGSSLSGGLDSSIIVCAIDHVFNSTIQQNTFSARFPGFVKDEGVHIQKVLDQTNVVAHFTFPDYTKLISHLEKLSWHQEEPFSSASVFVQYDVMQLAKLNNVTVLLDGQGADEIFAGYHSFYPTLFNELKKRNRSIYVEQLTQYQQLHQDNRINSLAYKPGITAWAKENLNSAWKSSLRKKMHHFRQIRSPFLNTDFFNAHKDVITGLNTKFDGLNHALYNSTTGPGLQELLRYADRNSMAHSREVRLPFLFHDLVEFVFKLPAEQKIKNGWTKYLLRSSFEHIIPTDIAWRKDKIGYEPPQQEWLSSPTITELLEQHKSKLVDLRILHKNVLSSDARKETGSVKNSRAWQILMAGMILQ
ncbi:asparagine synthase (glutamine-hydrolyzing) [Chitinophaga lutea]|uniref:asparagine synthase (glutamine-hydrolyzing) n=1 Tax=Chitinophaga lutea TaxID=2488634 RepID=A0A3N4PZD2_9BACT|nr:asparagine synthase (glutamine-hydrolyzing) [Chitinophaga lutea]RPE13236.1 asparagine synthase (glutamine-hydrolyzing) [Chitinophaga lutea]